MLQSKNQTSKKEAGRKKAGKKKSVEETPVAGGFLADMIMEEMGVDGGEDEDEISGEDEDFFFSDDAATSGSEDVPTAGGCGCNIAGSTSMRGVRDQARELGAQALQSVLPRTPVQQRTAPGIATFEEALPRTAVQAQETLAAVEEIAAPPPMPTSSGSSMSGAWTPARIAKTVGLAAGGAVVVGLAIRGLRR